MNADEAIKYISEWLKDEYALNGRDRIVLTMAIEALRNEINCVKCVHYTERETYTGIKGVCKMDTAHREDLISRQDIKYHVQLEAMGNGQYEEVEIAYKNDIESLPSADRPTEWIPVSERLPKEGERVLTYDKIGDIDFGQYDKGHWYWEAEACADYWTRNDGVLAWMPLPEPYKGGE